MNHFSRANFPIHGSITTAAQGPHAMHITLNRVNAPAVGAAINQPDSSASIVGPVPTIQGRSSAVTVTTAGAVTTSTQSSSQNTDLQQQQQRSVSLNQEAVTPSPGVHHHIHHPLNNPHHNQHQMGRSSTLPFSGPPSSLSSLTSNKLQHPGLVQPAKVIPSHALQQQGAPSAIKSGKSLCFYPCIITKIMCGQQCFFFKESSANFDGLPFKVMTSSFSSSEIHYVMWPKYCILLKRWNEGVIINFFCSIQHVFIFLLKR